MKEKCHLDHCVQAEEQILSCIAMRILKVNILIHGFIKAKKILKHNLSLKDKVLFLLFFVSPRFVVYSSRSI